jgi:hypothetical protein
MLSMNKKLELDASIANLLASYIEGIRLLTQTQGLLKRAEDRIERTDAHPDSLPEGCRKVRSSDVEHAIAAYKRDIWRRIMSQLFLQKQVSVRRFQEIQKKIEAGDVPELTIENLQGFAMDLLLNKGH